MQSATPKQCGRPDTELSSSLSPLIPAFPSFRSSAIPGEPPCRHATTHHPPPPHFLICFVCFLLPTSFLCSMRAPPSLRSTARSNSQALKGKRISSSRSIRQTGPNPRRASASHVCLHSTQHDTFSTQLDSSRLCPSSRPISSPGIGSTHRSRHQPGLLRRLASALHITSPSSIADFSSLYSSSCSAPAYCSVLWLRLRLSIA